MPNEELHSVLKQQLAATHVEIIDNSWQHAGHVAMANVDQAEGTHLDITIVTEQFEGVPLMDRHRMVHQSLKDFFAAQLHALELKVYTPIEWLERAGL